MKRFFSLLLALMLLVGSAVAESEVRTFTADEQAYDAYLDIAQVYADGVFYLEEMGALWSKVIETGSNEEIDYFWFSDYLLADENRFTALLIYSTSSLDISEAVELINYLVANTENHKEKTDVIWMCLSLLKDANYVEDAETIKQNLDNAMAGIRSLMAMDREYPFLKDLQTYYKDAVLLYEYIADFSDNYTGFTAKLGEFQKSKTSWEVDFEFIFNPDDFDYVREVRNAEKMTAIEATYQKAVTLEKEKNYEDAIKLYGQCGSYKDSQDRVSVCREMILATIKANARLISTTTEQYTLYKKQKTLDSKDTTTYTYDENGILLSLKVDSTIPKSEIFTCDETGSKISSIEKGMLSSNGKDKFEAVKEYNEYGDIISKVFEYDTQSSFYVDGAIYKTTYEYTYDANGYMTEKKESVKGENISYSKNTQYTYTYEFNEAGLPMVKIEYIEGNPTWKHTYTYDERDFLVFESMQQYQPADLMIITEITYQYD